jgi:hypothetical protein
MVLIFLSAVMAGCIALTSGAAVLHEIQNVRIRAASGAASNERLYPEPDGHHGQDSGDRPGQS